MPVKVSWTRLARADLLDIYELIGVEQPLTAERYFDRIERLPKCWPTIRASAPPDLTSDPASGCWLSDLT